MTSELTSLQNSQIGSLREAEQSKSGSVLTVSIPTEARAALPRHVLAPDADVAHTTLAGIDDQTLLGPAAPSLVLSPLTGPGFDAMDLLTTLREIGFEGRYLVLAPSMPDIPLIRAEMLAQSEGLDVDVIALGDGSTLHEV